MRILLYPSSIVEVDADFIPEAGLAPFGSLKSPIMGFFLLSGFFQVIGVKNLVGRIAHLGAQRVNLGCFFRLRSHIVLVTVLIIMSQIIPRQVHAAL